jgi:hypothetical protein
MNQAKAVVLLAMMLPMTVAQAAAAQTRSACIPRSGGVDLCAIARAIEREVAPRLPAKVHANATFQSISAVGPRVVVNGILHAARRGDPALAKLRSIMPGVTRSLLCRHEPTAGFVRQGGEIRYVYRLEDGSTAFTVTLRACASPRFRV